MPYTTFSDGSVLTATQVNTNFRDQVISSVTSATRPAGTEGQVIYETDTDLLYVYNGSGWVRFGAGGGWTSYTPTLTQSSTVTKTTLYAKYEKIGRQVAVQVALQVTGTGVANNPIQVSLPFTAASIYFYGSGYITDSSAVTNYPHITVVASTTAVQFMDCTQGTGGVLQGMSGSVMSAALAVGDVVVFGTVYESAT